LQEKKTDRKQWLRRKTVMDGILQKRIDVGRGFQKVRSWIRHDNEFFEKSSAG
jgi:hypothetical protein